MATLPPPDQHWPRIHRHSHVSPAGSRRYRERPSKWRRGVLWLRMPPVPGSLNHINVWALEDGEGWTLVDTGMQTPETAAAWQSALAGPLAGRPVIRVICTHMHPDHIGMAGWLTRRFDCPLDGEIPDVPDAGGRYREGGTARCDPVLPRGRLGCGGARALQGPFRKLRQNGVCAPRQLPADRGRCGTAYRRQGLAGGDRPRAF